MVLIHPEASLPWLGVEWSCLSGFFFFPTELSGSLYDGSICELSALFFTKGGQDPREL